MTARALDETDLRIVRATQAGLPLAAQPYRVLADMLDLAPGDVMARISRMLDERVIRRIGAVPNHFALGYRANAMSVWDVADDAIDTLGPQVGALEFVSHCYRRPRRLPDWPYNLFAMVHGRDRDEVAAKLADIGALLGAALGKSDVLYSVRILKKTGLRLS